jgi:hypothetical protein
VDEVRIPVAGDPFYAASRRTHEECIGAMHEEEARLGRKLSDGEREGFARGFHAPEYRTELRRLAALGVEPDDEDAP